MRKIFRLEARDRLEAVELVAPELRNVAGAGEPSGHADDRDGIAKAGLNLGVTHDRIPNGAHASDGMLAVVAARALEIW